jgi:hypothetical protein
LWQRSQAEFVNKLPVDVEQEVINNVKTLIGGNDNEVTHKKFYFDKYIKIVQ